MVAGGEHGLEAGEVGVTGWDDMAGVEQLAVQFLNVVENVRGTCRPFRDRVGIFGLLGRAERYPEGCQVPCETDVRGRVTEVLIFCPVPRDAEPGRDDVDVIEVVCETKVFCRAGGVAGEVEARKVVILVEFLKGAIFESVTSVPDLASLTVHTPVGDVQGPPLTSGVVFGEALAWYSCE